MTTIIIKKSRHVAQTNNSMFAGAYTAPTRNQARVIASKCKANGIKVLSPVKGANGWVLPHKGGTLSLRG